MQPNWTQTNTSADDYIKNKPTLATVATSGSYNDLSNKPTIPSGDNDIVGISDGTASDGEVVFSKRNGDTVTLDFNHSHPQYALANSLSTVATSGDYDDLTGKPTKVSDFTNDSGFTSNAGTITGITMNGASKGTSGVVDLGTVITAHQDISGKANTSDLATVATSGSYNDLSNKPTIPAAQVNADWNATSGVSRILNKPTIPTVPTKVSSFTNDAGYLTQHQSLANYYTKSEIDSKIGNIETLLASI